ncbi:unnamed protein product [Protopolystoma xenopodis]|uniref:Uncharacterized protein n=1 Tax=Protopolystoma xenopodis TaxID=117903 RepID=A0A448XPQ1_9PLAT|nr:unnamed protein product [Protopolystoma xenopodis]
MYPYREVKSISASKPVTELLPGLRNMLSNSQEESNSQGPTTIGNTNLGKLQANHSCTESSPVAKAMVATMETTTRLPDLIQVSWVSVNNLGTIISFTLNYSDKVVRKIY